MLADNSSIIYRNGSDCNSGSGSNTLEGLYEFLKEAELQHYFEDLNLKLKVRSIAQLKYVDDTDLQSIGMTRPEMRRLKKYFAKEFPQTAMGKIKKCLSRTTSSRSNSVPRSEDLSNRMHSFCTRVNTHGQSMSPMDNDELTTIASITNFSMASNGTNDSYDWRQLGSKHLIMQNQLTLGTILRHGDFGDIYKGNLRSAQLQIPVAVKVINKVSFKNDIMDIVREIFTNCYLDHPSIVRLYGISIDDYSIKMVTELAQFGSLTDSLQGPRGKANYPITVLHSFILQICDAMNYLEERRVVHGRLIGRNVLLFSDNKVKITDAGLFRAHAALERHDVSETCLWLSPEIAKGHKESSHSDVWAFGCLLWEMYNYCQQSPSSQMEESMSSQMDMRIPNLPQPDLCPSQINELMKICWTETPKERPTFSQLTTQLSQLEPELVIALVDGPDSIPSLRLDEVNEPSDGSYSSLTEMQMLYYKADETIVVLDRSMNQYKELWRGCLLSGESGYFKWASVRTPGAGYSSNNEVRSPLPTASNNKAVDQSPVCPRRSSSRNIGEAFSKIRISRKDDKKRVSIDMISGPQNDFRHVGHVGSNGDVFGDVTSLYTSAAQKQGKRGSTTASMRSDHSTNMSEISSLMSTITLNAGDDTPPYATIDSEQSTTKSNKVQKTGKQSVKKDDKVSSIVHQSPPVPPVRGHSEDESNANIYLDELDIGNSYSIGNESFSLFDELAIQWELQYSKIETPKSQRALNIVTTEESRSRKSPTSFTDYSEVYDEPSRTDSNCDSVPPMVDEYESSISTDHRSISVLSGSTTTTTTAPTKSILQKLFGSGKSSKQKSAVDGQKSPIYAKVRKPIKQKKPKEVGDHKKIVIGKPVLISGPMVVTTDATTEDNFLDCSSEVSSLQPSPRESLLCLSNTGVTDPSPNFNRQYSNITNNSRGKTSDSTITSVSSASSFASLTSAVPTNNVVLQGGAALRALRKGDNVFRAPSAVNALNRKRPSVGQIQVDQFSNEGTMSRTRKPSLPLSNSAVKAPTSTIDRRNTLRSRVIADHYDPLDGVVDSSATTPIASELPDLPYLALSLARPVIKDKVNPYDEEDAYNSLHSGSLGSDTIEPRSSSKPMELFSVTHHNSFQSSTKCDKLDAANNKSEFTDRLSHSMTNSKYLCNFQNNSNIFSLNGDNDEVAL